MKKLLIVLTGVLCLAGFASTTWAHSSKAGNPGFRSHVGSKPHLGRHSHPRKHFQHKTRHFRHQGKRRFQRQFRRHWYYGPYYGPSVRYSDKQDLSQKKEESPQVPQHSTASQLYYNANPEPWFLYGKGKEFRQMGLIPPLPQTSQDLK